MNVAVPASGKATGIPFHRAGSFSMDGDSHPGHRSALAYQLEGGVESSSQGQSQLQQCFTSIPSSVTAAYLPPSISQRSRSPFAIEERRKNGSEIVTEPSQSSAGEVPFGRRRSSQEVALYFKYDNPLDRQPQYPQEQLSTAHSVEPPYHQQRQQPNITSSMSQSRRQSTSAASSTPSSTPLAVEPHPPCLHPVVAEASGRALGPIQHLYEQAWLKTVSSVQRELSWMHFELSGALEIERKRALSANQAAMIARSERNAAVEEARKLRSEMAEMKGQLGRAVTEIQHLKEANSNLAIGCEEAVVDSEVPKILHNQSQALMTDGDPGERAHMESALESMRGEFTKQIDIKIAVALREVQEQNALRLQTEKKISDSTSLDKGVAVILSPSQPHPSFPDRSLERKTSEHTTFTIDDLNASSKPSTDSIPPVRLNRDSTFSRSNTPTHCLPKGHLDPSTPSPQSRSPSVLENGLDPSLSSTPRQPATPSVPNILSLNKLPETRAPKTTVPAAQVFPAPLPAFIPSRTTQSGSSPLSQGVTLLMQGDGGVLRTSERSSELKPTTAEHDVGKNPGPSYEKTPQSRMSFGKPRMLVPNSGARKRNRGEFEHDGVTAQPLDGYRHHRRRSSTSSYEGSIQSEAYSETSTDNWSPTSLSSGRGVGTENDSSVKRSQLGDGLQVVEHTGKPGDRNMGHHGPSRSREAPHDTSLIKMKLEPIDDIRRTPTTKATANNPRPLSKNKIGINHMNILYETRNDRMVCRMCRSLQKGESKPIVPVSFPTNATWPDLVGHCRDAHPQSWEEVERLSPSAVAELLQRMSSSQAHGFMLK